MVHIEAVAAKRAKVHTKYYLKNGQQVPGVTTALNVLAKPALIPWAWQLGAKGIGLRDYVDALATIGSIAHDMVLCHHKGTKFESNGYAQDLIDCAENSFLSYLEWARTHEISPGLCEVALVSEKYGYGGTVDFYGVIDGVLTIIDYKTGKAIYPEHLYQVAAYRQLIEENGYAVDAIRILQIGRDETEGFSEKSIVDSSIEFEIFKHCLELYNLMRRK